MGMNGYGGLLQFLPQSQQRHSVFSLVSGLLDALLRKLDGDHLVLIPTAVCRMLSNYTRENLTTLLDGGNDFSTLDMRIAYIFKYMASHCNTVRCALRECTTIHAPEFCYSIGTRRILNVLSIGGGPGSEFLGLIGFLRDFQMFGCSVDACLVDICEEWGDIQMEVEKVVQKAGWDAHVKSIKHNVLDPLTQEVKQRAVECDVITFVKVVSSIGPDPHSYESLVRLLRCTPVGCLLVYVDNAAIKLSYLMRRAAIHSGFVPVFHMNGPYDSIRQWEREALNDYMGGFVSAWRNPVQVKTYICISLFRKVTDDLSWIGTQDVDELPIKVSKKRTYAEVLEAHPLANLTNEERAKKRIVLRHGVGGGALDVSDSCTITQINGTKLHCEEQGPAERAVFETPSPISEHFNCTTAGIGEREGTDCLNGIDGTNENRRVMQNVKDVFDFGEECYNEGGGLDDRAKFDMHGVVQGNGTGCRTSGSHEGGTGPGGPAQNGDFTILRGVNGDLSGSPSLVSPHNGPSCVDRHPNSSANGVNGFSNPCASVGPKPVIPFTYGEKSGRLDGLSGGVNVANTRKQKKRVFQCARARSWPFNYSSGSYWDGRGGDGQ